MKQLVFILLLIIACSPAFAGTDSIYVWNKWCLRSDTLLLFTASYNMIKIYSPGFKPSDIYLKSLDKTLKISGDEIEGDSLTMLAMPYTTEKPMRLAIVNKSNNKVIKTLLFNGTDVPAPLARLGYITDSIAPKPNILAQVGLNVIFPNSLYGYPYHIKEFVFKTRYNKADITINGKGHYISTEIEKAITKVPFGTIIEFTNIKATCHDCVTRTLEDLKIRVKQL